MGLIKGIPLPEPEAKQLVNGHFVNDSFLTILKDQTSWVNTMEFIDNFCVASWSNISAGQNSMLQTKPTAYPSLVGFIKLALNSD